MEGKEMPPKVKVTKESIIEAAFQLLKEHGITKVNARELAKALHCSVQPIFRSFQQMENLKKILYQYVEHQFDRFMESGMQKHRIPFLGMGLAYIEFAKNEKNLFKFLFMSDEFKGRNLLQMIREESNHEIIGIISAMSGLSFQQSQDLFLDIWLITHGIASLMATNDCDLNEEQIETILMDTFAGVKVQLKTKGEQRK
jgi:AcrR family transcriptional regulator